MRLRLGNKHHLRKICRSKSTNQFGERNERLPDLCFSICRFFQVVFIPQAQPHSQSLFLFPIVFGINLIHFFDISTRKNGAARNSIVCFAASIPCRSRNLTVRRMRTVSKSATFLATESVNSAPFTRGETEVRIFWQGIAQNSSSNTKVHIFGKEKCKTHR